ncbi:MAG: LLM class F420-dependent oxidoreductase [Chloroflexi bacterium]|nr:LLM class F420-dependent oxidoreductase [Chloroflexota bacterium]
MKFGIHNPSWLYPGSPDDIFEGIKQKVLWAEENDFVWFSVMDHMIQIPVHGAPEEPMMEAWTTLSALAATTSKIRLGALVTSTSYRNPALLAKMVASVDIISKGRVTLGIGAGWYKQEYGQYHFDYQDKASERIYRLEDAIKLIKTMWTEERATYNGKYFNVTDAILEPKSVQKPHPPILIGGGGEQLTLRTVARVGDASNFIGTPDLVRHKYEVLKKHCENEGRNYAEIERTVLGNLLLGKTEASLRSRMNRLDAERYFTGRALTISEAVDLFGQYKDASVQLLICSIYRNDQESLELLQSEIMPKLS